MPHKPIQVQNLALVFPQKTCFQGFTAQIHHGSRIGIIGRNGSGKSTLLKMLMRGVEPSEGSVAVPKGLRFGYVPQIIDSFGELSGGQRFNKALTQALKEDPQVLLLDEPTNHLDEGNRASLLRLLRGYEGTLIIVTHDIEVLKILDTLWDIRDGAVHVFSGHYEDYMQELRTQRASLEKALSDLERQKKQAHQALMKEQERAKKSKAFGEKKYADDKLALRSAQGQGEATHSRNKKRIASTRDALLEQLSTLRLPEQITPSFGLCAASGGQGVLVEIRDGTVAYGAAKDPVLKDLNFALVAKERIALRGPNGSGKSTLLKAILRDPQVLTTGSWRLPKPADIGYLDQHYATLDGGDSALSLMFQKVPSWPHEAIRRHLNAFLFRKNEEVNTPVAQLSGGEKARLSLALIAAVPPKLLILDEIANNLDLQTKEHVVEILKGYPGAMIVVSHEEAFLQKIGVSGVWGLQHRGLQ